MNNPVWKCSKCGSAFGNLRPSDICEGCEDCKRNVKFEEKGGLPGMLLTGSRENLANAMRVPGVAMNDVVVVNAGLFDEMCDFIETFTTIAGQTVLLMGADNAREIYDKAVEISGKLRGEK